MFSKRKLTIQVRMSQEERQIIEELAIWMRRSCSDALRVLALEKADILGLPGTNRAPGGSINLPPSPEIVVDPADVVPEFLEALRRGESATLPSSMDEMTPEEKDLWDTL